jgi:hypothetical protein
LWFRFKVPTPNAKKGKKRAFPLHGWFSVIVFVAQRSNSTFIFSIEFSLFFIGQLKKIKELFPTLKNKNICQKTSLKLLRIIPVLCNAEFSDN